MQLEPLKMFLKQTISLHATIKKTLTNKDAREKDNS